MAILSGAEALRVLNKFRIDEEFHSSTGTQVYTVRPAGFSIQIGKIETPSRNDVPGAHWDFRKFFDAVKLLVEKPAPAKRRTKKRRAR